ncbi:MAG: dihydrodipicolinate synthase family protein [Actinobacteria bacterium]|nr:dihydrodipicolinate synthase family protein [Actinomycetota bacterium]
MSTDELAGVHCALATPFDQNQEVDEARLRSFADEVIADGVAGLVVGGSTGECSSLTTAERMRVTEVVAETADGRVALIPHVGSCSIRDAREMARHAESVSAAAILAVSPYYEPLDDEEVTAYYAGIAEVTDLPIIFYNLPIAVGANVDPERLARFCERVPSIRYVKESTGDLSQIGVLTTDFADTVRVFNGWDTLFLPALVEGAIGAIVGTPNFAGKACVGVYRLLAEGDAEGALAAWERLRPLMQVMVSGGYANAVKAAMEMVGRPIGPLRSPLLSLGGDRREALEQALDGLGLLAVAGAPS